MTNNMDHQDAAIEEILHLMHDTCIGVGIRALVWMGQMLALVPYQSTKLRFVQHWILPSQHGWLGLAFGVKGMIVDPRT
jgi:hypothetical protein